MSQDEEEVNRAIWAHRAAERIVDGALTVAEGLPKADRKTLLGEIARRAIWHMQNSADEARDVVRCVDVDIDNLKQHSGRLKTERPPTEIGIRLSGKMRAAELAANAIDGMADAGATPEERDRRRLRLTEGPLEFREDRVDQPKLKK